MDFSLRRVGDQNIYYHEAGEESAVQIVFTPGCFNPELWKHQLKYFSRNYRAVAFGPTKSNRSIEGERKALENVLEQENVDNAVLVSSILGNRAVQEFENHHNVVGTVLTGIPEAVPEVSKNFYRLFWAVNLRKPKLMKKLLFSSHTDYSVVKEFCKTVRPPEYEAFKGFAEGYSIRKPSSYTISIHPENDRFSSMEQAKKLTPHSAVSVIRRAGTFSFWEKPQEYNKILNDFLVKVENAVRDQELVAARENNRSLWEYGQKEGKKRMKVRK